MSARRESFPVIPRVPLVPNVSPLQRAIYDAVYASDKASNRSVAADFGVSVQFVQACIARVREVRTAKLGLIP